MNRQTPIHLYGSVATLDPHDYLGLGGLSKLSDIIAAIKDKYPEYPNDTANSDVIWPTEDDYKIMKDICETLNNREAYIPTFAEAERIEEHANEQFEVRKNICDKSDNL